MKPFVFNKDSWHYWLAKDVGSFSGYIENTNICEYTRAVLKGAAIVGVVLSLLAALAYWITITLVWWVVIVQYGFFYADAPAALSAIVVLFGTATLIAEGIPRLYRKTRDSILDYNGSRHKKAKVKTDNFLSNAYRSWKEKTCVRVTLIGDNEDD